MNVPELLAGRRICVCAGSGGVGKTTTSAVIGLGMAARGLRVCVITIDPARRLANALGLDELSNEPRRVDGARWRTGLATGTGDAPAAAGDAGNAAASATDPVAAGELWAMMLDPKRTFDDLIDAAAPTVERAAAIKANGIYRQLSSAVAGSQEFTAVSKLYELAQSDRFDLLVLDTPPARNALDFLEAPQRLTGFLEGRALQALARPTGLGVRLLGVGAAPLLSGLKRITGLDLVSDISTFLGLLGPMAETFGHRARAVEALLRSPETAFLLIASAQAGSIDEAVWFAEALARRRLPFSGMIVNRFHHDLVGLTPLGDLQSALTAALAGDSDLATRVAETMAAYHALAVRDGEQLHRLRAGLGAVPLLAVPQFDAEIADVSGLARIHAYLFGSEAERAALIATLTA